MPSLPASSQSCSIFSICTIRLFEVVSSEVVEVSAHATDMVRVCGWQVDMDRASFVVRDRNTRGGFKYNSSRVALDVDGATTEI